MDDDYATFSLVSRRPRSNSILGPNPSSDDDGDAGYPSTAPAAAKTAPAAATADDSEPTGHMETMVETVSDYLRAWDLNPQPMLVPRKPRTQWGGVLHLLYLPVLLLYLVWIVSPIYGPLPSCCLCPTQPATANNSWLWRATQPDCDADCQQQTNAQLTSTCRQLVGSPLPAGSGYTASFTDVTCYGDIPGEPCSQHCDALSASWLQATDYMSELNVNQAALRCPSAAADGNSTSSSPPQGVCQFMALWYNPVSRVFPQGLCRYPSVRGLLAQFGAALGLISGLFVTIRSISRSAWIQLDKKSEPIGSWSSFLWGFSLTTVLNYAAFSFYLLSPRHVTKMARYGSQAAVGMLLLFAGSPLIVVFVYIFAEMWPALLLTALLRIGAVGMTLYTACLVIICDLDRNELKVRRSLWASTREPRWLLVLLMLCGLVGSVFAIVGVVVRNYFAPVTSARRSAVWRGATAGLCLAALVILWCVITPLDWWQGYLTFDLPVSLTSTSSMAAALRQSLWQGAYSVFSSLCIVIIAFAICAFIRELPVHHDSSQVNEPRYQPRHFRLSFAVSVVPSFVAIGFFLAFSYTAFQLHDPSRPGQCQFPWLQLGVAVAGIIPSVLLWIFGRNRSLRSGAFSGIGFNIVALGEAFWILAFDFCLGKTGAALFIGIWFVQLVGAVFLIFGVFGLVTRQRIQMLRIDIAPEEQINYAPPQHSSRAQSIFAIITGDDDDDDDDSATPLNLKPIKRSTADALPADRSVMSNLRSSWAGSTTDVSFN